MPHSDERPMMREFVRIGGRPVLWFSKGQRRNQLIVPTVTRATKDKELHQWQQGNPIWEWIEPLTSPNELIVDPFAGSGEWGYICGAMGRRWIGCDVVEGGSTEIVA
jgi:hypothetical protein